MKALSLRPMGLQGEEKYLAREGLGNTLMRVMSNVRSFKGKIETAPGLSTYISGTLNGTILKFFWWTRDTLAEILTVCTTTKLYRLNTATEAFTDITHAAGNYTGGPGNFWDACGFNGQAILTNGVNLMQVDDGTSAAATDITATGAPTTAFAVASFQTYCLAGYTDTSPRQIKWCDTSDITNWNTNDAGNLTLAQSPGPIFKMLPLGEVLVVYRPWSIHVLFYVGSPFIFAQRQVLSGRGPISPRAVADLGPQHIYWGREGFFLFDGANRQQIGTQVFDDAMAQLDPQYFFTVHAQVDMKDREVYFYYPKSGDSGVCKQAYVYNYWQQTWREASGYSATGGGYWKRFSDVTWANAVGAWNAWPFSWIQSITTTDNSPVLLIGDDSGNVRFVDNTTVNVAGSAMTRTAETGLFEPAVELWGVAGCRSTLNRIEIEQENSGSHNLEVWVGTQDVLAGDAGITWTQYTIIADGSQSSIAVRHTAQFFAFRFQTSGASQDFRISGIRAFFVKRGAHT